MLTRAIDLEHRAGTFAFRIPAGTHGHRHAVAIRASGSIDQQDRATTYTGGTSGACIVYRARTRRRPGGKEFSLRDEDFVGDWAGGLGSRHGTLARTNCAHALRRTSQTAFTHRDATVPLWTPMVAQPI